MTSIITPNTVNTDRISMGGGILYMSPTVVTDKDSLPSNFRNVGLVSGDNDFTLELSTDMATMKSGTPLRDVYSFIRGQELDIKTTLSEIDHQALAWATGEDITYTVGTPGTTVAATPAPTASVFTVASATGLTAKDLIEIDLGTGGTADKHYRWIKSVSGSEITLGEALPEAPAASDTVKEVSKTEMLLGYNVVPTEYSLKYIKVLPVLNQKLTVVVFKAITSGRMAINFKDGDFNGLPISFKALADSDVESGALGVAWLEANT